jgi:hypothetical protein
MPTQTVPQRYVLVDQNNVVQNVCNWTGDTTVWQPPTGYTAVQSNTANIGDTYNPGTQTFTKGTPATPPTVPCSPALTQLVQYLQTNLAVVGLPILTSAQASTVLNAGGP